MDISAHDHRPRLGLFGAVLFLAMGAWILRNPNNKERDIREQYKNSWFDPLAGRNYVPQLRFIGVLCILAGVFLLVVLVWSVFAGGSQ